MALDLQFFKLVPIHCLLYYTSPSSLLLNNGMLPTEWKLHAIISVFKSGDKSIVKNYHPVSLLSNISKALKRLIYIKICILDYYSRSISHCQFGFCKIIYSTTTTLLYFNDLCFSEKKLTVFQIALSPDVKIGITRC